MCDADERIVDAFLDHYQRRAFVDVDAARAMLLSMYPLLGDRLEIVEVDGRRFLVKRPLPR